VKRYGIILLPETVGEEGFLRGVIGGSELSPYVFGSEQSSTWIRGWCAGQLAREDVTDVMMQHIRVFNAREARRAAP
jgi:hypothetical protein